VTMATMESGNVPAAAPQAPERVEHTSLREALNAVATELSPFVERIGRNTDSGYDNGVSHPVVLEHCRDVLLRHGVVVIPLDLTFERMVQMGPDGRDSVFMWRHTFKVAHTLTKDKESIKLDIASPPTQSASAHASTVADKLLMLRLCRLASKTEPRTEREPGFDVDEHGEVRQPGNARRGDNKATLIQQLVAALSLDVRKVPAEREALIKFWRRASGELGRFYVIANNDLRAEPLRTAFDSRCRDAGLVPKEVAEAAFPPVRSKE
jgi:hypothetical protein